MPMNKSCTTTDFHTYEICSLNWAACQMWNVRFSSSGTRGDNNTVLYFVEVFFYVFFFYNVGTKDINPQSSYL